MNDTLTSKELAGFLRRWADDLDPTARATGVLVPLYIRPGPVWDRFEAARRAHPRVPLAAIVNPHNGPGSAKDASYTAGIQKLVDTGCTVIGYVLTDYMKQPLASVKADIQRWKDWYPQIYGVFIDEVVSKATTEAVRYYTEIRNHAAALGFSMVIGNPGTTPEAGMFPTANILIVHESASVPTVEKLKEIQRNGGEGKMAVLIHDAKQEVVETWVPSVKGLLRYLYATEDVLPNPWNTLSARFERTMELLDA